MKILLNILFARKCYKIFRKPSLQRIPDFPLHLQFSGKLPMPYSSPPNQLFLQKLLKAMFVLAFCEFLRIGGITRTTNSIQHFLLFENVAFGSLNGKKFLDITFHHFKHSKRNNTTLRILENPSNSQ